MIEAGQRVDAARRRGRCRPVGRGAGRGRARSRWPSSRSRSTTPRSARSRGVPCRDPARRRYAARDLPALPRRRHDLGLGRRHGHPEPDDGASSSASPSCRSSTARRPSSRGRRVPTTASRSRAAARRRARGRARLGPPAHRRRVGRRLHGRGGRAARPRRAATRSTASIGLDLTYGELDWSGNAEPARADAPTDGFDVLSPEFMRLSQDCYLPGPHAPTSGARPRSRRRYADLRGLPPCFVSVGTCDHLLRRLAASSRRVPRPPAWRSTCSCCPKCPMRSRSSTAA